MCREVTLPSSSSWMYIAYNLLLIWFTPSWSLCLWQKGGEKKFLFYFDPFVDDWQKGGEVFKIYACFPYLRGRNICFPCLRGSRICVYAYICFVLQIGEKEFDFGLCLISMFTPSFAYMIMSIHCIFICLFPMHELRGSVFEALL